jgi:hypothetical protein
VFEMMGPLFSDVIFIKIATKTYLCSSFRVVVRLVILLSGMAFQRDAWDFLSLTSRDEILRVIQNGAENVVVGARIVTIGEAVVLDGHLGLQSAAGAVEVLEGAAIVANVAHAATTSTRNLVRNCISAAKKH